MLYEQFDLAEAEPLGGGLRWLVPAGDIDALAKALDEFLAIPLAMLERMGESAHIRALKNHSIDVEASKLAQLIMAVIPQTPQFIDRGIEPREVV